jgi:mono/diheme cytochrome c family protein
MMKRAFMTSLLAIAVTTGAGWSQETEEVGSVADGKTVYERYCATCHGLDGTGQGPMQAVLTILPNDLTALTAKNDGVFPLERVVKRIDGRDPLVAHGSPMPVYGDFFETGAGVAMKTDAGQPVMTSQPVADLVAYLRSLQTE